MNITKPRTHHETLHALSGVLLVGGFLLASCAKSNDTPPPSSTDAAAGTGGQTPDAASAVHPDDAGHCPMQGAFAHDGVCVCQAAVPTVCDDVCTDTQNDVDHCGACATKCPATSVCNQGACSVPPVVLLAPPAATTSGDGGTASCGPLHLALAGTTLYWADEASGTINSLPTSGGAPTLLASGQLKATALKVVGGKLFWLAGGTKIMRSPLAAATPSLVATVAATDASIGGFDVTPDGTTVYFSSVKRDTTALPLGAISQVAAAGGAVTVVGAEHHGVPGAVAVDGTTVAYVVDQTSDVNAIHIIPGMLAQCGFPPVGGSSEETSINCDRLGRSQGSLLLDTIFAFGGTAYWIATDNFRTAKIAASTSYDVLGSAVDSHDYTALAIDGTTTGYLAETGSPNCLTTNDKGECTSYGAADPAFIEKVALAQGAKTVPLARFTDPKDPKLATSASSVAVDATKVYFARTDCAILSVAK
jgi:hypothetical protein